jgi:SAM-dependent methyltransferase
VTTNDTTSQFFDGYARDFDAIYGNANTRLNALVNRVFRKSMRLRFDRTIAGCDPVKGKTIIDIGCGPGHYALTLAKRGAAKVFGLDFAKGMIDIAKDRAKSGGVSDVCTFEYGDFMTAKVDGTFDHAVVMGFMDYMSDPRAVIERTLSLTNKSAFFSFPADGGVLAWQRKLRYKRRCDLFMYSKPQIERLFAGTRARRVTIDKIARDFFVTAYVT